MPNVLPPNLPWKDWDVLAGHGLHLRPRGSANPTWLYKGRYFVKPDRNARERWWGAHVWRVHRAAGAGYVPSWEEQGALVAPYRHDHASYHDLREPPGTYLGHHLAGTLLADWLAQQDDRHRGNYLFHPSQPHRPVSIDHGGTWAHPEQTPLETSVQLLDGVKHHIGHLAYRQLPLVVPREKAIAAMQVTRRLGAAARALSLHTSNLGSTPLPTERLEAHLAEHPGDVDLRKLR